jgi:hypothetical protein
MSASRLVEFCLRFFIKTDSHNRTGSAILNAASAAPRIGATGRKERDFAEKRRYNGRINHP